MLLRDSFNFGSSYFVISNSLDKFERKQLKQWTLARYVPIIMNIFSSMVADRPYCGNLDLLTLKPDLEDDLLDLGVHPIMH
ncbi:hypothetical protein K1719_016905 [Acacia pycnantha]|nr:hypothetical protein K1719_016905 [Acacia pycnantha]